MAPDVGRVAGWLARSRKDLELARDVLARIDRDRAMAVPYEAGYRCFAGLLDLAGYRVTSQPGPVVVEVERRTDRVQETLDVRRVAGAASRIPAID